MVYRGPYKIRVEEKDVPAIEHPNDAIVRVELAAAGRVGCRVVARLPRPVQRSV